MQTVKVFLEDGNSFVTQINGSKAKIMAYYLGNYFNMGTITDDIKKVVDIEFLED